MECRRLSHYDESRRYGSLTLFFAASFLLGVAAAAYFLVRGVERRAKGVPILDEFGREFGSGRLALTAPGLASFLSMFGLAGFAAIRIASASALAALAVAILSGAVSAVGASRVVAKWARYAAAHDVPDERFALQGHVATVVRAATSGLVAQIQYSVNGRRVTAPALGVDNVPLPLGAEVVIDRLEEGVLYVETWPQVEARI